MYQALYRKWRPRTFDEVVGQEHITSTLKRQVETGRLSHAYLFIGTRGTGKTTCAKLLARAVNCEHPVNGNPCNQCPSCRGIEDGSILDVVEMDAASNNRVDDVRALQDEAIFSPASVKKRVYIIDEVHMLSTAAFNALLKILEEPPAHLMFILCTTELRKVLPTIVSRCQRHSFTRIDPDAIAARLLYVAEQEHMDLAPDAAALLARMADGGMRDALSLLDQCAAAEHIDADAVLSAMGLAGGRRTAELLDAIRTGDTPKALTLFDGLWRDGKDPAGILDELGSLMRDVLLLQVAPQGSEALLSGVYEKKTLQYFAAKFSGSQLMDAMGAIRSADLTGTNPRRAAELCLVRLCVPETGDSLAGLRNRISRLEAALQSGAAVSVPAPEVPTPPPEAEDIPADVAAADQRLADDAPWYTDDDAPPAGPEAYIPPEPVQAPVPPAQTEVAPAPAEAARDSGLWESLLQRLNGKLDMGAYALLMTPSQVSGTLSADGNTLTVHLSTPIARMMLDTPATAGLFQQELRELAGRPIAVSFTDQPAAAPAAPDMSKLDALSRFSNFKFE